MGLLQSIIVCANDDPRMTLSYFTSRSSLESLAFTVTCWRNETVFDFLGVFAALDLRVGRCIYRTNGLLSFRCWIRGCNLYGECCSNLHWSPFETASKANTRGHDVKGHLHNIAVSGQASFYQRQRHRSASQ